MLIFHAADLHLGKSLGGYDLLDDQAFILAGLLENIERRRPDCLLIAGDIYDRAVPPVEAIKLFDSFLRKVRLARPGIEIVIVPGNHDSAGRLSFAATMLADSGVRIAAQVSGEPAVVFGKGAARTAVWALPFLTQASAPWAELEAGSVGALFAAARPAVSIRSQQELMELAVGSIRPKLGDFTVNILVAHCFAAGALAGDSEQAYVGLAEQVDSGLFSGFDYVALGHLHRCQSPAPRAWYAGSPLAYSIGDAESEKGFVAVDFGGSDRNADGTGGTGTGASPKIEFVPLVPKRALRRLSGFHDELLANPLPEARRQDYVEILLLDDEPFLGVRERFKEIYPNLLAVRQSVFEKLWAGAAAEASIAVAEGRERHSSGADRLGTAKEDFLSFHREMTGEEPPDAMTALFEAIAKEAVDAAD